MTKQALFIDGPNIGEILYLNAPDNRAPMELIVPDYATVRLRFDPQEFPQEFPQDRTNFDKRYYSLLRGIYPFFHCYTVEPQYSDELSHRAVKFIELAVEQQRAETVRELLDDFERKNAFWINRVNLMEARFVNLSQQFNAVLANHNLSTAMDETSDDDN